MLLTEIYEIFLRKYLSEKFHNISITIFMETLNEEILGQIINRSRLIQITSIAFFGIKFNEKCL